MITDLIQLMLGHVSIQQTQRYLNVTDEEPRRGLEVSWNNKGDAITSDSEEQMHAAFDINIPSYARANVTTNEVVDPISSLRTLRTTPQ